MGQQSNGSNPILDQEPFRNAQPQCANIPTPLPEPEPMVLQLVSREGDVFEVLREHALASGTIRAMLADPDIDMYGNVIDLPEIRSEILHKICVFFEYKALQEPFNMGLWIFPEDLIEPETAHELLWAAVFLNC